MDLSYYLSEILEQRGEVNVPGLGRFAKVRVAGYFNEAEEKFYPPRNEVQFNTKAVDVNDDTLANYIAGKKDISPTSAKFFVSQYVTTVLQDAAIKEVQVGELGWLGNDGLALAFRSKIADPAYFGLPVVEVHKVDKLPIEPEPIPELSMTIASENKPEPSSEITEIHVQNDTFEEEEADEEKRGLNVKLIAMIIAGIIVLATVGLYIYDPSIFGNQQKRKPLVPITSTSSPAIADTTTNLNTTTDTAANAAPAMTDTAKNSATQNQVNQPAVPQVPLDLDAPTQKIVIDQAVKAATAQNTDELPWQSTWAIIGGTFSKQEQAEDAADEFKARSIDAQVIGDKKGRKKFVVIGTYPSQTEAANALKELKKSRKTRKDIYIKEFKK
ncbi:hypothetical protein DJ568_01775 [Mucilaginibacter hurinus]|uniref:SPOR domain-containing protein n=1 Tax=Mucilaginibacter hurinus TaxID=2201324 RepID=A0A367GVC1_9SPHI|nr:SPOR domain-containing protein [Mucilaginibacter hurinus]RCH56613.1 hypothetical protein DJ568_01775 [Mucilaginibacter hurinus]